MNASRTQELQRSRGPACSLLFLFPMGVAACSGFEPEAADLDTSPTTTYGGVVGRGAAGGAAAGGGAGSGFGGQGGAPPATGGGSVGDLDCTGPISRFVTHVVSVSYGPGQSYGQDQMPEVVLGPPLGGGCCTGSLDVVSLGDGGEIIVAFGGNAIVDGPGPDFVVFENAFQVGGNPSSVFAELATVAVSADGQHWVEFPCTATTAPFGSCAGWHPVLLDGDDGPIDPATCGGDPFDLADVGITLARYVRITDRADTSGVFDLDAVGIINAFCL